MAPAAAALSVAPTGARRTRADHPALPLSPAEIAETAAQCLAAGACLLHLHVRRADGSHSLEAEDYRPALEAVRRAVGERMVVQITTEAVGHYTIEQQIALVKSLHPEAVSLALREVAPDEASLATAAAFFEWMHRERIIPQVILYSADEVRRYHALQRRGALPADRHWVIFVLGRFNTPQVAQPAELVPFLQAWAEAPATNAVPWALCAFGPREAACAGAALALGGHARVGFENNLALPDGTPAASNAQLVAGAAGLAQLLGRPLAQAAALRGWFA